MMRTTSSWPALVASMRAVMPVAGSAAFMSGLVVVSRRLMTLPSPSRAAARSWERGELGVTPACSCGGWVTVTGAVLKLENVDAVPRGSTVCSRDAWWPCAVCSGVVGCGVSVRVSGLDDAVVEWLIAIMRTLLEVRCNKKQRTGV